MPPRTLRPGQRAELHVIDVTTGERELVYSSSTLLFEAPNWTPDGALLVINGDGLLFRVPASGGAEPKEIPLGGIPPINNDHVLSPDGRTVYVSADDGHLYAVEIATGRPTRVSNDRGPEFHYFLHGISPDGATLAYIGLVANPDGTATTNVYTIPATGGEDVQLTDDSSADDGSEFSPDGEWIYFNSERGSTLPGHAQLFRMSRDGARVEQLTEDERVNWFPHISPDGNRIAYISFPSGTLGHPADLDVILRLIDNGAAARDLVHLFGGQGTINVPSWAPDSRRIAFVTYPIEPVMSRLPGTDAGSRGEMEGTPVTVDVRAMLCNDGTSIPALGLGVFQMSEAEAEAAVVTARRAGYRLVDSAAGYENEGAVGRAIARFDRDDFYITTKLKNDDHGYDETLAAFDSSMAKLGIDTLDLYLIHWPSPGRDRYVDSWRALIRLRDEGRVTSIGVSNFEPHHLRRIIDETGVVPVINQIELHPFLQQRTLREAHQELGILTEAWSPLGQGRVDLFSHPTVVGIAGRHGATPAQVTLAWHLAIGNVVIPKSVTASRQVENLASTRLELSAPEVQAIAALDSGLRMGPHPDDFN